MIARKQCYSIHDRVKNQAERAQKDYPGVSVTATNVRTPLDDNGACGADGRYDVFIWHVTTVEGDAVAGNLSVAPKSTVVLVVTILPVDPLSTETLSFDERSTVLSLARM